MAGTTDNRPAVETAAERQHLPVPLPAAPAAPPALPGPPLGDPDAAPSLLDAARREPRLPIVGAVLGAVIGLLLVALDWTSYHATARVVLRDPWAADIGVTDRPVGGDFQRFVRGEARFMLTDDVIANAAEALGQRTDDLEASVAATATDSGDFIDVVVGAGSRAGAEARLEAVLAAYSSVRRDLVAAQADNVLQTIGNEAANLQPDDRADLERRAADLRIALAAYGDGVAFVESQPATPDLGTAKRAGLPLAAGASGAGLGAVAAWIWIGRRRRVEDPDELARRWSIAYCGALDEHTDPSTNAGRVAADAVLLSIATLLRSDPPRSGRQAYVVGLAAANADAPVVEVARRLAAAATEQGARCHVLDTGAAVEGRAPLDALPALAAGRADLVVVACGPPERDPAALHTAGEADVLVLVVCQGCDADDAAATMAFYDRVGSRPHAVVAWNGSTTR